MYLRETRRKNKHGSVVGYLQVTTISARRSRTTVGRALGVLAGILDDAVEDHRNPARGVRLPRKVRKEHVYLRHDELRSLAAAAGEHCTLVLLLGYTGLRWGEVTALRVKDLDQARRRLSVVQNAVAVGTRIELGTPKTHEQRSVPYPQLLDARMAAAVSGKDPGALVFPNNSGSYLRPGNSKDGWFARAVRTAGLPHLTPHDLRHTAASLAISSGANPKALQQMLGHASAAMTLDTYSGLFPDDLVRRVVSI